MSSKPSLSLFSAVNLVAASMIGAGVYTTSGFALADLGSPWRVLAAWLVGGVIALSGALSYGALAKRFVASGGEYLFLSRAVHPAAGYVAGFVSIIAGFTGATAIAATAFESYFPDWGPIADLPEGTVATLAIVLAASLHGIYARLGAPIQDAMVILKFVMLGVFLIVAAVSFPTDWKGLESTAATPFRWSTFAVSLMWISLSYSGFNAAIYVAAEVQNPQVNVPRSLWIGTLVVTVLYLLLNTVFVLVPTMDAAAGQKDIAVIAARAMGGSFFESLIRGALLVSLATSISAMMMSGPRVCAKMADDGALPSWFRFQVEAPTVAIAMQAVLAIAVVQVTGLQQLLSYLGFTLSVSAALTVAWLFLLRFRGERVAVPFYPFPPLLFVAATLMVAAIAGYQQPRECMAGLVTLAFGAAVYFAGFAPQAPTESSDNASV
ncbi:MAG: APC family permease [Planctomycetaceae bacterium]